MHLAHRQAPEIGDAVGGGGDALVAMRRAERLRLHDDVADVVGDHVVQLLGDSGALLGDGDAGPRLALPFGVGRALLGRLSLLGPLAQGKAGTPDAKTASSPTDAVALLHDAATGIPRALNNLAAQALIAHLRLNKSLVDESAARAAITEVTAE